MKIIAVMSPKGGIGKTTTSDSIAYMLGEEQGKRVLVFEYHTFLHHSQTSNLKMNCFHLHKTGTQTSDGY